MGYTLTTVELLATLRTLLDESVEGFWKDGLDCYPALTDGQNEYTAIILAQYKAKVLINPSESIPEVLRPLYKTVSATTNASDFPLPTDFLYDISVQLGSPYSRPLLKRELSRTIPFDQANTYSGTQGYYYSIINDKVNLEIPTPTNPGGLSYTLEHFIKPTKIDSNTNPILPEFTHLAIVIYAFAQLLKKAQRGQEALGQYQEFLSLIKYL